MFQIPDHGTIIAPSSLHLPLYQEILKQKGNCGHLQILSLSSYVAQFLPYPQHEIELLYKYKEALQQVSAYNAFIDSVENPDFLKSCLSFLRWCKLYHISNFPSDSPKQESIKEILDLLMPIPLKEEYFTTIEASDVYLLKKEYAPHDFFWLDALLSKGAKWLDTDAQEDSQYIALSNAHKQAKFIAQTILKNDWKAEDVAIFMADSKDEAFLEQAFLQHHIPYTLSKQVKNENIKQQWIACIQYGIHKDYDSFLQLLKTLYPYQKDVQTYFELFPQAHKTMAPVCTIDYQPNEFIDANTYHYYQELEAKTWDWMQAHDFSYAYTDFEHMASLIQNENQPTKENLAFFASMQEWIGLAQPYIHQPSDLNILLQHIQNQSAQTKANQLEGVFIASINELCALRTYTFITTAHGKVYPALQQESGIFDEAYIQDISLPSLQNRLDQQAKYTQQTLQSISNLIITYPENNYDGSENQASVDIERILNKQATFMDVIESEVQETKHQKISKQSAHQLYAPKNIFYGSVSRLESFAACPYKHFLQYGLHLQEQKDWTDIRVQGSLLHAILEQAIQDHGKNYVDADMNVYVDQQYAFIQALFPHRQTWIENEKHLQKEKLKTILQKLKAFEANWNMSPQALEHHLQLDIEGEIPIHLSGYIDRIDASNSAFVIFDYKSGSRKLEEKKFASGLSLQLMLYTIAYTYESQLMPYANAYLILSTSSNEQLAYKVDYRKSTITPIDASSLLEQSRLEINGWAFQDTSIYTNEKDLFNGRKNVQKSYETKEQEAKQIVSSLVSDILNGDIAPEHEKDACQWCSYASICRNTRKEVEKQSRLPEQEETQWQ